jgi:hypothetical protein
MFNDLEKIPVVFIALAAQHPDSGADYFDFQTLIQYLWDKRRLDRRDCGQSHRRADILLGGQVYF